MKCNENFWSRQTFITKLCANIPKPLRNFCTQFDVKKLRYCGEMACVEEYLHMFENSYIATSSFPTWCNLSHMSLQSGVTAVPVVMIRSSLSKPHNSRTSLQDVCVFMSACLWPYTEINIFKCFWTLNVLAYSVGEGYSQSAVSATWNEDVKTHIATYVWFVQLWTLNSTMVVNCEQWLR